MSLTEFLLARIAEDEVLASLMEPGIVVPVGDGRDLALVDSTGAWVKRIRDECSVKRRIVDLSVAYEQVRPRDETATGAVNALRPVLMLLALPYADHPDYRGEFRP